MDVNEHTNEPLMESCYSSSQILEEGTPDKVTKKVLSEALERYTLADEEWKGSGKIKDLFVKAEAGDHLFRLAKAILDNNGFYTYRDAVIDSMAEDGLSPSPEDFE